MTGNPHLTLVSVGCCSRARVCLDRRSETQIFVDPAAFMRTYISTLDMQKTSFDSAGDIIALMRYML